MDKDIQAKLEYVRQLSPEDFVRQSRLLDSEILRRESLTAEELQSLRRQSDILLAGATDVQVLALAEHDMREYGLAENVEASAMAIEALWDKRAAVVAGFDLPRVGSLTREAALEMAREIKRNAEMHQELNKELQEHPRRLRGAPPEGNINRA